ncbi:MAG: MFS transporter, partial [Jatrophihabitantaceae bacterium]
AINVPVAAVVVCLGLRHVPETRAAHSAPHLDVVGTLLVAAALGCVTFGTTLAGSTGWTGSSLGITLAGAVFGAGFVAVELISPEPLVPLDLFASRAFNGTNVMTLLTYAALSAMQFILVLHLQISAGYGALAAGLATAPITIVMLGLSARSGALASRIGPRLQLTAGPLIAAAGMALLLPIDASHRSYLTDVLPGVLVFSMGVTTLVAPLTATVMASAPGDAVGIASGVNNAVSRVGGLLAIAVLPPLAGLHGETYRRVGAMVHGYRVMTVCCAGLLVIAAAVTALTVRNRKPEAGT